MSVATGLWAEMIAASEPTAKPIANAKQINGTIAATFLDSVYIFAAAARKAQSLDYIYNTLDEMLLARRFTHVDAILEAVDVNRLPISNLLSILFVSLQWKSELQSRSLFFDAVKVRCESEAPARSDRLLLGWDDLLLAPRLERSAAVARTVFGVAIGVTDIPTGQLHVGILHRVENDQLRMLELQFHARV